MEPARAPQTWSSRLVFLLATVGAAVGLGNIWKFPYTAGVSGGGAFVLIYLLAIVSVAVPVVMAELMIGRRGRASPVTAFQRQAEEAAASAAWRFVGWLNISAVFLILSFYSVVAGWAVSYVPRLASGRLAGATSRQVVEEWEALLRDPGEMAIAHALFMGVTVAIVSQGLHAGIERAVRLLMPMLFAMLLVLVGYAALEGDLEAAARFLFAVDFSQVDASVVLAAIGQAFFSVGVAMGLMMVYGAYMRPGEPILTSSLVVVGADTLVALVAGLAVFPLVFAHGLDPAEGPGLVFVSLPVAFTRMPAGSLFGAMFFLLLVVAALTSSIAILETVISRAVERAGARRARVTLIAGLCAWLLGMATVFSFNYWKDVHLLAGFERFSEGTVFDLIDFVASNLMLPLGATLIAWFAGRVMPRSVTASELALPDGWRLRTWRFLIRWVAPASIGAVLVANLI
jgi:NSS family neurotransmitter:Na+ symporter